MAVNSRLFMEIGFVNDSFQAIDKTPYERWINEGYLDNEHEHLVLQRIVQIIDGDDNQLVGFDMKQADTVEKLRDPYEKKELINGLYYYQKILIPSEEHVTTSNVKLYFDSNLLVHYEDTDEGVSKIYNPKSDFDEIYEVLRDEYPDNCFYFDDYAFTIYSLVECYILTERERINNYLKNNCRAKCNNGISDLDTRADILMAAIYVLRDLIEKKDFFEAQRILNGLNTCGNLCKKYTKTLKGCGCGKS